MDIRNRSHLVIVSGAIVELLDISEEESGKAPIIRVVDWPGVQDHPLNPNWTSGQYFKICPQQYHIL